MSKRYSSISSAPLDSASGTLSQQQGSSIVGSPSALSYAVIGLSKDQTSFSTNGRVQFDTIYQQNGNGVRLNPIYDFYNYCVDLYPGLWEVTFIPIGECNSAGGVGFRTLKTQPSSATLGETYVGNHEGASSGDLHYTTSHCVLKVNSGTTGPGQFSVKDLQVITLGSGSTLPTVLYGGRQGTILLIQELNRNHQWWGKGFVISSPTTSVNIGTTVQSTETIPSSSNDITYNSGLRQHTLATGKIYLCSASASIAPSAAASAVLTTHMRDATSLSQISSKNLCLDAGNTTRNQNPMNRSVSILESGVSTIVENRITEVASVTSTGSLNISREFIRELDPGQAWFSSYSTIDTNVSSKSYITWTNTFSGSYARSDGSGKIRRINNDLTSNIQPIVLKGGSTYRLYGGIVITSGTLRTRWVVRDVESQYEYSQRALCKPVNVAATDGKFGQPYLDCIIPAPHDVYIGVNYVAEDGGLTTAAPLAGGHAHLVIVEIGSGTGTDTNSIVDYSETATSYSLDVSDFPRDRKKLKKFNNASTQTINVLVFNLFSLGSFIEIGASVSIMQEGAGQVVIAPAVGVTIRTASTLTTRAQYSVIELTKIGLNEWIVQGDLTP